jgi:hypothetical protein
VILMYSRLELRIFTYCIYKEHFYFVDWFHGSVFHGDQCTASWEVHMNFSIDRPYGQ